MAFYYHYERDKKSIFFAIAHNVTWNNTIINTDKKGHSVS